MTLTEWMQLNRKNDSYVALQIGRDRSHINKIRRGKARPSFQTMAAIKDYTNGKVGFADWEDLSDEQ